MALKSLLKLAKRLHHTGPYALPSPGLKILVDRTPVAKVPRDHPPLIAGLVEVQDAPDHLAQVTRGGGSGDRNAIFAPVKVS